MNELTLHPNVYQTGASKGLVGLLERLWVREHTPGEGTIYIISGFANYNGGVRFYDVFRRHIDNGGRVVAFLGGSTSQRLSSKQVVRELLQSGAEVNLINRKRLMHAKSYGVCTGDGEKLIVTSGNFTGPGMSQNVELSVLLDSATAGEMDFSWEGMTQAMLGQRWDIHRPDIANPDDPAWQLLYDEEDRGLVLDESDEATMVVRLGHADTARIMAIPGTSAYKGSQYFWLSKDAFGFFPPLTILNRRGYKSTYSTMITMNFVDLGREEEVRVTFEADNNLDFRLGTGPLRGTQLAQDGDIAAITRRREGSYELRIYRDGTPLHTALTRYAISFIGHRGKMYGYLSNSEFDEVIGLRNARGARIH
ncbi:restriction endonuclease (plasmid) [Roseibium aggregatum]|uniref:phospholipase D-like domain-containing protein n=1 Tax=Roseibium aggregatum TaxID=187304 RepID=UPI001E4A55E1|nr:phospholipase D-like domain-containing protein [Roseibium aggregatum]UES60231.1 restriction endonuclease [Roseibium aggregatum]